MRCPRGEVSTFTDFGAVVRLPGLHGSIAPAVIAVALAAAVLAAVGLARWRSGGAPPPSLPLWACGADDLTARMQYTATSFAEPLQRVFDDVLRPDTDIEVTHPRNRGIWSTGSSTGLRSPTRSRSGSTPR